MVQRAVREASEVANCLPGLLGDVSPGELVCRGAALLSAAALGFAA